MFVSAQNDILGVAAEPLGNLVCAVSITIFVFDTENCLFPPPQMETVFVADLKMPVSGSLVNDMLGEVSVPSFASNDDGATISEVRAIVPDEDGNV